MGASSSKHSNKEPLLLCQERTQFIKQAVDSRYALSAAHLSYIHSLRSIGTALRQLVEAEVSIELSVSTSEPDKTPSRSSYASLSPPQIVEHLTSPLGLSNLNYVRATGSAPMEITLNPSTIHFVEEGIDYSWDYFDPIDRGENFSGSAEVVPLLEENMVRSCTRKEEEKCGVDGSLEALVVMDSSELHGSKMQEDEEEKEQLFAEREDASEFITHRAKDFLSSMKDIEHRFLRAAESGDEVSKLLETSKIRLCISNEIIGTSPTSQFLSAFHWVCCKGETILNHEPGQNVTKIITWNRSISSLSSSPRDPLMSALNDGNGESSSDFIEEFCMISGSHSSTLDRLYAWEKKLYDEVKASEAIRKAYEQKCSLLRHQFAKDLNAQVIDKTRAVIKDLHSQIRVSIQAVDSISKKIEKLRDEELQPQLEELIHGLIRMWKAMLECHHTQFITISLAYHVRNSPAAAAHRSKSFKQALIRLYSEVNIFASSFTNLVVAHRSYVEALNSWVDRCTLHPQEQSKRRINAAFSSPQLLIFVLCQDWLDGIKSLPLEELADSVKRITSVLCDSFEQQIEEEKPDELESIINRENRNNSLNFDGLQTSLVRLFDRLTKFSEASLKTFEDVKKKIEMARIEHHTMM